MDFSDFETLLHQQRTAVFTTYRRDGRPQMSLVGVCSFEGGAAFTTRSVNAKIANLKRDPRCAFMLVRPDWRAYAVLDGDAEVRSPDNTDRDKLRLDLRSVYRGVAGRDHPDWEEYDRAMVEQDRYVIILRPGRMYGVNHP